MSVVVRKFEMGKNQNLDELETFLRNQSIDRTQVILAQAVQVSPGNSAFILVYEDVSPPYVTGQSPADGATGIPTAVDIVIQMSEPIADPSGLITITRNGVTLTEGVDYNILPTPWPAAGNQVITIQNAVDSTYNASYVVTLSAAIADVNGNTMTTPYAFSFSTTDQVSGLIIRSGQVTPTVGQIAAGFVDIVFGSTYSFPDTNYRVLLTLSGDSVQPGVVLRVNDANKAVTGFRVYFDAEDFSTVETRLAAMLDAIDTAINTEVNTNHVGGTAHNDASGVIALDLTGIASSIVDRAFQTGNHIEWLVEHGAPA